MGWVAKGHLRDSLRPATFMKLMKFLAWLLFISPLPDKSKTKIKTKEKFGLILLILLLLLCKVAFLELSEGTQLHVGLTWHRAESVYEEAGAQNSDSWWGGACGRRGESFRPAFLLSH